MCGAFDAVSFSVGDIGSHWSNGLCCCDLVRDNYAADSSGVFFVQFVSKGVFLFGVSRLDRVVVGAATKLSDSFSILSLWLRNHRVGRQWSMFVFV